MLFALTGFELSVIRGLIELSDWRVILDSSRTLLR